jgi:hypothetical protein
MTGLHTLGRFLVSTKSSNKVMQLGTIVQIHLQPFRYPVQFSMQEVQTDGFHLLKKSFHLELLRQVTRSGIQTHDTGF